MVRPRLLSFDVDGTLLDSSHQLSPRTADALAAMRSLGIPIVIATGRPIDSIGEPGDYADFVIGGNGTIAIEQSSRHPLFTHSLAWEETTLIVERLRREIPGVRFTMDTEAGTFYEPGFEVLPPPGADLGTEHVDILDSAGEHVLRVAAFHEVIEAPALEPLVVAHLFGDVQGGWTGFPAVDIVRAGSDKAVALGWLANHLSIDQASVWAFGDGMNDLGMLSWAGRGHAMGNAPDRVKHAANVVIASNDDHGVAQTLEELLR